jgi:hypothetical protein
MKKRLEADLISIAHRILQLKNKSDINQLYLETQKLYEKLAVLRFVEDHFGEQQPTIGQPEIVEKIEVAFENDAILGSQRNFENYKIVANEIVSEKTSESEITDIQTTIDTKIDIVLEEVAESESKEDNTVMEEESAESNVIESQPAFELDDVEPITNQEEPIEEITPIMQETEINPIAEQAEEIKTEAPKKTEAVQISFEDLLGGNYAEPQFVKRSQLEQTSESKAIDETPLPFNFQPEPISNNINTLLEKEDPKTVTLNDKLAKGINIGLNDRIAFVKHLFGGDSEDYNRVLSQLITFDTFQETKEFIDEIVKPDYNNWEGKEDFEHRFMEIIEKKFLSF